MRQKSTENQKSQTIYILSDWEFKINEIFINARNHATFTFQAGDR